MNDNKHKRLAKDILSMAASGGMPDSFWSTDQRIQRACKILGWHPYVAREWAQAAAEKLRG